MLQVDIVMVLHGMLDVYAALQPIVTSTFKNALYVGGSSVNTASNYVFDNSVFRSSIFGDGLISGLDAQQTQNYFFDALNGGFKYDVSQDILVSKTPLTELNFDLEFNKISQNFIKEIEAYQLNDFQED